ncbi:MAG: type II secretion system F family protein [Phycisphaeraceae bacterium]|nr:type II secretion system F family protein [Phycisphaerales bacterium]MCB9861415.1 type II secretion system F family protein [Phycisphaeraceae bacterium]
MAVFRYKVLGADSGFATIEALDRPSAVRELVRKGITPGTVEEVSSDLRSENDASLEHAGANISGWRKSRAMNRNEMTSFVRELATALDAGLPLVQAIQTLGKQGATPTQKALLTSILADVESGKSLGDAAANWGKPFSDLTISMFRAGDASGEMAKVLSQTADLLEKDLKLRRQVVSALIYPLILLVLIGGSIAVILTVVVPKIIGQLGQGAELPLPTRILLGSTDFLAQWWWLILASIGFVIVGIKKYRDSDDGRLASDRMLLQTPLLGRVLRDVAVARFTRTLGTLTGAGIPILNALRVTKATLGNRAMEVVVEEVADKVSAGRSIAEPMDRSGYFPAMLVQIVNLGERSGRLDEMLLRAADAFEDRSETSIRIAMEAFKPMLVVVLALLVGGVIVAVLLPIIQMQESLFTQ